MPSTPQNVPLVGNLPPLLRGARFGFRLGPATPAIDFTGRTVQVVVDPPHGSRVTLTEDDFTVADDGTTIEVDKDGTWSAALPDDGVYQVVILLDDTALGLFYMKVWTPTHGEV